MGTSITECFSSWWSHLLKGSSSHILDEFRDVAYRQYLYNQVY